MQKTRKTVYQITEREKRDVEEIKTLLKRIPKEDKFDPALEIKLLLTGVEIGGSSLNEEGGGSYLDFHRFAALDDELEQAVVTKGPVLRNFQAWRGTSFKSVDLSGRLDRLGCAG